MRWLALAGAAAPLHPRARRQELPCSMELGSDPAQAGKGLNEPGLTAFPACPGPLGPPVPRAAARPGPILQQMRTCGQELEPGFVLHPLDG